MNSERKRQLQHQHSVEIESLEQAYKAELDEFNLFWDDKFKKFEDKSKQEEVTLNQKQAREMDELYVYLEQKIPKNVKFSKSYIDLKSQEEHMIKQQRFKEAALLKKKLEEMDKADTEKFNKEKYEKIKAQSVKTANKHMAEKAALRKKVEIGYELMKKERQQAMEKLLLKYKNRKTELDNQQKQELFYLENDNILKKSKFTF